MKRVLIALTASLFLVAGLHAQGQKSLKQASKSLNKFTSDFGNKAALEEAKMYIEEAFQDEKVASSAKSWNTRGDILRNIADSQIKQKLLNPDFQMTDVNSAVGSVDAYLKALELATKGGDKKNAIKGLQEAEGVLNNVGIDLYQSGSYEDAFTNFNAELKASEGLKNLGETSRLDEGTLLTEKLFFAGLTGFYGQQFERSVALLRRAEETGTSDGTLYQFLYEAQKSMGKKEAGLADLRKGRELFPEDAGLLFSEINYLLDSGEKEQSLELLSKALEKEPDNTSVMTTAGQVYDQLYVEATEAKDEEKSNEYFDKALGSYNLALEKNKFGLSADGTCHQIQDDGSKKDVNMEDCNALFEINYNIGALYYNKAVVYVKEYNDLPASASMDEISNMEKRYLDVFDQALPYFLNADSVDGTNRNTLIALKEIYVRKGDFDKSNTYKDRLESVPE